MLYLMASAVWLPLRSGAGCRLIYWAYPLGTTRALPAGLLATHYGL